MRRLIRSSLDTRRLPAALIGWRLLLAMIGSVVLIQGAAAQSATTARLLLLQADDRRAPTTADISLMRISARSGSADTARVAIRMLGRLERPSLIVDLLPGLRHPLPEVRTETANALAQASQGLNKDGAQASIVSPANTVANVESSLIARLAVEAESPVRGAICEALARLPYQSPGDADRAEAAIVGAGARAVMPADRLGVAKALEFWVRAQDGRPPSATVLATLNQLAGVENAAPGLELARDARVRRLAVEALTTAGAIDAATIARAAADSDAQVRRLAMRAIAMTGIAIDKIEGGLADPSPLVRIDALRALRSRGGDTICAAAMRAAADSDMNVALIAIDQLAACAASPESVARLAAIAADTSELAAERGWHRQAHAIVALATAAPEQARRLLPAYQHADIWQVRAYAARAAGPLGERPLLDALARDSDDRVADLALAALQQPLRRPRVAERPSALPAVSASEVRQLVAPRARITVRNVGTFEMALFTTEAPGTVLRFVRLAESGYYTGRSFDRLAPNAVVQAGSGPQPDAEFPARETGTWPHVRGTMGVSSADGNDAEFFINLVDNPRFDHELTVFAQLLNGADVVDRLLEGDVIESITIVP